MIVLGTDGIWEARNSAGEIFGRKRFYNRIRQYAAYNAAAIVDALVEDVKRFQTPLKAEDDITMAVVKVGACA